MKFIKKIKVFIIITAVLALASQSFSDPVSITGKVTKVANETITIETANADGIPAGSRVDLFFPTSDGQDLAVGQWKVSSSSNGLVFAIPVDAIGPPMKGMTAKISYSKGKKTVQVIRQDHSNSPPMSQNEKPDEKKQFVYDPPQDADKAKEITSEGQKGVKTDLERFEPQIRGKEPKRQLLGIPFPEKSASEYIADGNKYFNKKNYKMAIKEYEQCARLGNAECQRMVGLFYNNGFGVEKDFNKARKFYEESASQNNFKAIYNLGVMYANGRGVKKDIIKARELFLKSANMGYSEAQFNIGALYYNGMGVKKDKTTALKWFKKAAEQNTPKAVYVVGQAHEFGWGTPKNISKAKEYYKKAADLGDKKAIKKLKEI